MRAVYLHHENGEFEGQEINNQIMKSENLKDK